MNDPGVGDMAEMQNQSSPTTGKFLEDEDGDVVMVGGGVVRVVGDVKMMDYLGR